MEALQTMMRAWMDELVTKQAENLNEKLNNQTEDLKESLNNTISVLKQDIKDSTMQFANKFIDINNCIIAFENTIETTLCELTVIIESKREQTFIITDNNSSEITNTREECKIKIKQSYLGSENIQLAGYSHILKHVRK